MTDLVLNCKRAISTISDQAAQSNILALSKELADYSLQMLQRAKVAVTNPAIEAHKEVQGIHIFNKQR